MKLKKTSILCSLLMLVIFTLLPVSPVKAAGNKVVRDGVVQYADVTSPLYNRIIYYPEELIDSDQHYPVIIWANGTACPPVLYTNLLRAFAKEGYIVVASSEVMSADGKDQIDGIDFISEKNTDTKSDLYGHVDKNRITAMGHSQGGRSSVNAAAADSRFKCVISIAGSNYKEEAEKLSTPALFFTGTADMVVNSQKWVYPAYKSCTGPAAYVSLKKALHTTCCNYPEYYVKYAVKWMRAWCDQDHDSFMVFTSNGELSHDNKYQDFESRNLSNRAGSVFSLGNIAMIFILLAIAVAGAFYVKKKKNAAK